jgi:hypothetical protein
MPVSRFSLTLYCKRSTPAHVCLHLSRLLAEYVVLLSVGGLRTIHERIYMEFGVDVMQEREAVPS